MTRLPAPGDAVAVDDRVLAGTGALPPRNWRNPILLSVVAIVTVLAFGIFGSDQTVVFVWTQAGDAVTFDNTPASSHVVGWIAGIIALLGAAASYTWVWRRKVVPVWLILVVGLAFVVALLAWVGAGAQVPVEFLLSGTIGLSTAIIFGTIAGVVGERVGVVNIAIEGQLLAGAFTAALVTSMTDSFYAGLIAAMIVGALLSMILAAFAIVYLVDQVVVGVVLIALVTAVTNFLYATVLGPNTQELNDPGTLPKLAIPGLSAIPVIGPVLFDQRLTTYLMFVLVAATWFVLFKTRLGLRIRALGEHPLAADTVGIKVNRVRFWTVTVAGAIAGLGGAALTIGSVGAFVREMSNGQGFIALAAVILGRWHPFYGALAGLLFGFASTFRIWATQAGSTVPSDLITATPYVVTIIAVAVVAGRVVAPRASGKPYIKE